MSRHGFWGKFDGKTGVALPLISHCLDVGMVFYHLCRLQGIRRTLLCSTKQDLTEGHIARLAVLATLHDVGKANLGFQDKVYDPHAPRAGHIRELLPLLLEEDLAEAFLQALPTGMATWFADIPSANSLLFAAFSHHGKPFAIDDSHWSTYLNAKTKWWHGDQHRDPMKAVAEVSSFARQAFPQAFASDVTALPTEPHFHHRFAGLVMLADWIGSHEYWFPITPSRPDERQERNLPVIPKLLRCIGLDPRAWRSPLQERGDTFALRFGFPPHPLQRTIDQLSPTDEATRLLVAESETGSGKTEAALNWFAKLFTAGKVDSMYFALPTRVAARDLYARVNAYVHEWYPNPEDRPVTLLAVPGYTQVDGQPASTLLPTADEGNISQDDEDNAFLERHWAAERPKRFLAATIAVGTIDQALLASVQSAHAHMRSVCLERSLLVVDEVHASDLYMSYLLKHLLRNHLGAGSYAMLLSATLGSKALSGFINSPHANGAVPSLDTAISTPYPLLTLKDGRQIQGGTVGGNKRVQFDVLPLANSLDELVSKEIIPALRVGARILVVMNTVDRAITMLKALEANASIDRDFLFRCNGQICPHHGRFSPQDRLLLDVTIRERLGKDSPGGPIAVVGTQTLEQSLDIDGDLLITDLAPADVLLQRVGRLHRHNRQRPASFKMARCVVLVPEKDIANGLTAKGEASWEFKKMGFGSVYEDLRILALTLSFLRQQSVLSIPDDNRLFVEMATHPERLCSLVGERWMQHQIKVEGSDIAKGVTASYMVADYSKYFGDVEFKDYGRRVTTRLGANTLCFSLSKSVVSPFGQILDELYVPSHLVPAVGEEMMMCVEGKEGEDLIMTYEKRSYRYGRHGLEVIP